MDRTCEDFDSDLGPMPFKVYLSSLSNDSAAFRRFTAIADDVEEDAAAIPSAMLVAEFALVLQDLRIPGPCFLVSTGDDTETTVLGSGAQFLVQGNQSLVFPDSPSSFESKVAIKLPRFFLNDAAQLDLSSSAARRHVRDLVVELVPPPSAIQACGSTAILLT